MLRSWLPLGTASVLLVLASCAMLLALELPAGSWCYALNSRMFSMLHAQYFFIELPELSPGTLRRPSSFGFGKRRRRLYYFNLMIDPCLKDLQLRLQKHATRSWQLPLRFIFRHNLALVIRPNPYLPSGSSSSLHSSIYLPRTKNTVRLRPCSSCLACQQAMCRQAIIYTQCVVRG